MARTKIITSVPILGSLIKNHENPQRQSDRLFKLFFGSTQKYCEHATFGFARKKRRGSQAVNGGGLKHNFMRIKQAQCVVISALLVGSGVQIPSPALMRNGK